MEPYEPSQYRIAPEQSPAPGPYGEQYPGQPYPGQQYAVQPYPGQPYPGQPYPGQPSAGQWHPGQSYPVAPYALPAHGSAYLPPPWAWPVSRRGPYGPERPSAATAVAVLGFVTAGLTALAGIGMVISLATGTGDLPTALLLLGVPCAVGQLVGGLWLLRRRSHTLLLASSIAATVVLVVAIIGGAVTLSGDDVVGFVFFALFALPLPIVTACLAGRRVVTSWLAAADT